MHLDRIIIHNFKNIVSDDVAFSPKMNCICGNNGEGKTNLLDAVYYLSMTKSSLSTSDRFTFTYGTSEAVLHGTYRQGEEVEDIAIAVRSDGNKTIRRNGKAYRRVADHIGRIPVVMTAPSDISLIHDSGEERRRFLNMMISQMDRKYLDASIQYNRLLKQRNALLKQESPSMLLLDTITEAMCGPSEYLHNCRQEAVQLLAAKTAEFYSMISGGREAVSLTYRSDLSARESALQMFEDALKRDRFLQYSGCGVHRDDVEFLMEGHPLRKCASQGQQKSFLIALKMAQYMTMCSPEQDRKPILIFDDLFDKLDADRVAALIRMVSREEFGQIFITDTDETRLRKIVGGITTQGKFYTVCAGQVKSSSQIC